MSTQAEHFQLHRMLPCTVADARLITLNAMQAADEITEEQSRQMLFDIENAYNEFFRSLGKA